MVAALVVAGGCGGGDDGGEQAVTATTASGHEGRQIGCPSGSMVGVTCSLVPIDVAGIDEAAVFVAEVAAPSGADGAPIAFVGGDPGAGSVAALAEWKDVARTLRRDVILIDRRGTGRSNPRLSCRDVDPADYLARSVVDPQHRTYYRDALAGCLRTVQEAGLDLRQFDLRAAARDVEAVRAALGVERWVLAGTGYGGLLALAAGVEAPQAVEAVVLDGPVPPGWSVVANRSAAAEEAIAEFVARCRAATACVEDDGALDPAMVLAQDSLGASPVFVRVASRDRAEAIGVRLTRRSVLPGVAGALLTEDGLLALPAALREGLPRQEWEILARWRVDALPVRDWSAPAFLVAHCTEGALDLPADWMAQVSRDGPWVETFFLSQDIEVCADWELAPSPPLVLPDAVRSIPTLVMRSVFDPVIGRGSIEALQSHLDRTTVVEVPVAARELLRSDCGVSLMAGFLGGGDAGAEATCTSAVGPWEA